MRLFFFAVLVSGAVCNLSLGAEERGNDARRVTPPAETANPFDPSPAATARGSASRLSHWLSVGLCLGGGIWVWRARIGGRTAAVDGLWNVISRHALDSRHSLMVVQFADSLFLLSVSHNQISLLKEVDDPAQVSQITSLVCVPKKVRAKSLRQRLATLRLPRGMA